jgi:hypothetical protein
MLKDYFGYNLNDILKHKDISLKFEKKLANSNHLLAKSGFSFTFFLLCRSFCCINTIFS